MSNAFRMFVSGKGILAEVSTEARKYYEWQEKYMATERNTQFAGFAQLLLHEMLYKEFPSVDIKLWDSDALTDMEKTIAQRAYDLVDHTVCSIDPIDFACQVNPYEAILKAIPDLTELPEVSQ